MDDHFCSDSCGSTDEPQSKTRRMSTASMDHSNDSRCALDAGDDEASKANDEVSDSGRSCPCNLLLNVEKNMFIAHTSLLYFSQQPRVAVRGVLRAADERAL